MENITNLIELIKVSLEKFKDEMTVALKFITPMPQKVYDPSTFIDDLE